MYKVQSTMYKREGAPFFYPPSLDGYKRKTADNKGQNKSDESFGPTA